MVAMLEYTHKKAITLVIVAIVLALLFPSIFGMAFPSASEISYDAGVSNSTCSALYFPDDKDRSRCTTQFLVVVGNTGTVAQNLISVELDYVPTVQRMNWTTLDIVASSVRRDRATITEQVKGEGRVFLIENLAPNRLVEFSFTARGDQARAALENIQVTVEGEGRHINSNPHLTLASRFIRNVLGIAGF